MMIHDYALASAKGLAWMETDLMTISLTGRFFFPTGVFSIASNTSRPSITLYHDDERAQIGNRKRDGGERQYTAQNGVLRSKRVMTRLPPSGWIKREER